MPKYLRQKISRSSNEWTCITLVRDWHKADGLCRGGTCSSGPDMIIILVHCIVIVLYCSQRMESIRTKTMRGRYLDCKHSALGEINTTRIWACPVEAY